MSKPRIFIGSSVENLDVAYSAQESLEHDLEVTVWSQGIFQPSRYTMDDLVDTVATSDFALFVFAPDDVTSIRDEKKKTVRDNVVFELGLFIGRLGRERCFILVPKDAEELHLPTDLLGITPLNYEAARADQNLVAALGPPCQRIRRVVKQLGTFQSALPEVSEAPARADLVSDANDVILILQSWMGSRASGKNTEAMRYSDVEQELGLAPGLARQHIEEAAARWGYVAERKGPTHILFRDG